MNRFGFRLCTIVVAAVAWAAVAGCGGLERGLTAHSSPAAEAVGLELPAEDLGRIMARSPIPDSALTALWAGRFATLWSDYVRLATLYRAPDTARAIDFDPLLKGQRYYAATAVRRFRDSIVFARAQPTEAQIRKHHETQEPFTRLHLRRIRILVPEGAADAVRDSLRREAERLRAAIAAGEDFVQAARRRSDEPPRHRGRLQRFQGHEDLPEPADDIVYSLESGEVSPVIRSGDDFLIYKVEGRVTPPFEEVRDRIREQLVQRMRDSAAAAITDSILEMARRRLREGAAEIARTVAEDSTLESPAVAPATPLVSWEGGELTAGELRELFRARKDMQALFATAPADDVEYYLMQLAQDELLVEAANRSGAGVTEQERKAMQDAAAEHLAAIARQLGISHALVTSPAYDVRVESRAFLERALSEARERPWLGAFRIAMQEEYPARLDREGLDGAARIARRLREEAAARAAEETAAADASPEGAGTSAGAESGAGDRMAGAPDTVGAAGDSAPGSAAANAGHD